MANTLRKAGDRVLGLFRQDHAAVRYRSRLWYLLPVLFNLPGGLVAFFATRHDDPDKAKNCLLLGIILCIPFIVFWAVAAITAEAMDDMPMSEICAEIYSATDSVEMSDMDEGFIQILCD